jgi:predicted transcriptional regulator
LFNREREIAAIVYDRGLATAKEVQGSVGSPLSNPAVRSMLTRLVRKGVLVQQRCGGRREFIYAPAVSQSLTMEMAVRDLAADFYGGSSEALSDHVARLVTSEELHREPLRLPEQIDALAPRMREIASFVYRRGRATVREVQAEIEDPITVYGLRTLANRMVSRGIFVSRRSGRHSEITYIPALITDDVRRLALLRFVDDRFGGSPAAALRFILQLAHADQRRRSIG